MNVTALGMTLVVSFWGYIKMYVVFVGRLEKYSKMSICAFFSQ